MRQLRRFAWVEAQCCLFAVLFFLGPALVRVVPLPVDAADALLARCLAVTLVLWLVRWETGREVAVIFGFHLVGLAYELFTVRAGVVVVPRRGSGHDRRRAALQRLHVRRRRQLRLPGLAPARAADHRLPPLATACVAFLIYLNFFTSHVTWDVRIELALALLVVTGRTEVHFTVGRLRYAMPLALSFVLIGFFLWAAEHAATFLRAVPLAGVGLAPGPRREARVVVAAGRRQHRPVAAVKAYEGRLYGTARDLTVLRAYEPPPELVLQRPSLPASAGHPSPLTWVGGPRGAA